MAKKEKSRPTKSDDDPYHWVEAAVADAGNIHRNRRSAQYDGVLGLFPDHFPLDAQRVFLAARNRLLDEGGFDKMGYSPEIVRRFIGEVIAEDEAAMVQPEMALYPNTFMVPPADRKDIYTLAHLWILSRLDPEKALEKWSGKDTASGYKSRMAHRKRADFSDKAEVQRIARTLWKQDPSLTIAAIERSQELKVYKRRYKGRHTLRDWIKALKPRTASKRQGRTRQG